MCQDPGVDKTKPKRNLFDKANNLLTNLLSSGNLKNMPVSEGNEVIGSGGSKQEKKPSQICRHFLHLWIKCFEMAGKGASPLRAPAVQRRGPTILRQEMRVRVAAPCSSDHALLMPPPWSLSR